MGVEWFDLPKDNLEKAKSMLKIYSNLNIYQTIIEKIDKLQSVS